ncbi:MAG TPA: ArgE/DapE family deacylase [Opitutaceae bacterium]|jgi:succinyl-diaminopimelate desuccinylase|nr:ArgE/DapE family deacylase [Opitutaceae bacterium]
MSPSAYIDRHRGQLTAFLRDMVRIPTVNPPGDHYDEMTALLTARLEGLGLATRRYVVPKALLRKTLPDGQPLLPRYNVLGKWRVPGARRTLHFNAHYDVVPVSGRWRGGDPFSGAVRDGCVYGRGSADMKGSIASLALALQALRACGLRPQLNIEVSLTADEETDSLLGTGWLVRHAPIAPDYAVVMEGGEGHSVCCGHNGVIWLKVTVHGRAAHGSLPQEGINALEKMAALVVELEGYKRVLARRPFTTPEGRRMTPTINVGGVFESGPGGKINTVPALAAFTIDRRVLAVENQARAERELRAHLHAAAARIPQCRITIEKISENFGSFHPPKHPFLSAVAGIVRRVRRQPTVFSVATGFNDMYFFASELKIPTVGYGPGGEDCHAVNERAPLRELLASAKIYAELMTTFGG